MRKNRKEISKIIQERDLSLTRGYKIDGPWGHKGLNQLSAPLFLFLPGGEKKEIGEVIAHTDKGLRFELKFNEGYENIETASFEVPMRFHIRKK